MFRLFEWIYNANYFIPIDTMAVFEGNIIVLLFSDLRSHYITFQSILLSTIIFNDNNYAYTEYM